MEQIDIPVIGKINRTGDAGGLSLSRVLERKRAHARITIAFTPGTG